MVQVQVQFAETCERFFETNARKDGPDSTFVTNVLKWVEGKAHVMEVRSHIHTHSHTHTH